MVFLKKHPDDFEISGLHLFPGMLTCTVAVQNVSERKYAAVYTFEKENKGGIL